MKLYYNVRKYLFLMLVIIKICYNIRNTYFDYKLIMINIIVTKLS